MKCKFIFQILMIISPMILSPMVTSAKPKPITLEKLNEDRDFEAGCGCSVTNRKGDFLVFSEPRENAPAIVRIDGQKRLLGFVSSTESSGDPKLGDTFYRMYRSGPTNMRIDYKTTFVCDYKVHHDCEVTRYKVRIRLKQGPRKATLRNLNGDCGC